MTRPPFLATLGYQGRSVAGVIETLKQANIHRVIDVRLHAWSRQPEWQAHEMTVAFDASHIFLEHWPLLGNRYHPKGGKAVSKAEGEEILQKFKTDLLERMGCQIAMRKLAEAVRGPGRSAILCLCRSRARCHRGVIVDVLRERVPDLEVVDL